MFRRRLKPRIEERHLSFARKERQRAAAASYTWARADIPKPELEPLAPDSSYGESLVVASRASSGATSRKWYAGLAQGTATRSRPQIEQALAKTVAGSKTLDDSMRAVHRWVAQDFRYVSLSLGIARLPAAPAGRGVREQLRRLQGQGDVLRRAASSRMGVTAYPVLLSSSGGVIATLPSGHQFDHMIAAVDRDGRRTYVDLTADIVPYGSLPPEEQGEFGLVVHPDGTSEEITFPSDPATRNRTRDPSRRLADAATDCSRASGRARRPARSSTGCAARCRSRRKPDSTERARDDARDRERDLRRLGGRQPAAVRRARPAARSRRSRC